MDLVAWTRIETLFEEALRLPPAERTAWLRDRCGDDTDLFGRVSTLLDADAAPAGLFDGRALSALQDEDPLDGRKVGPWRVAEHVGVGGMGTVYRAERADGPYEQTVALKLVKRGMDTDAVLGRFQAERRILARLEHPGIARVLDGGTAPDGRPYLALDAVRPDARARRQVVHVLRAVVREQGRREVDGGLPERTGGCVGALQEGERLTVQLRVPAAGGAEVGGAGVRWPGEGLVQKAIETLPAVGREVGHGREGLPSPIGFSVPGPSSPSPSAAPTWGRPSCRSR